ncbi:MAG: AAA family ATPase [Gammaproteobacteria bacterium]
MSIVSEYTLQHIIKGVTSRFPLLYIVSWEEERVETALSKISAAYFKDNRPLIVWSAVRGFYTGEQPDPTVTDPLDALQAIADADGDAFYLLKDLPAAFERQPKIIRALRDLYQRLASRDTFVVLSYTALKLPEELKKEVFVVELPLPSAKEILQYLNLLLERRKLSDKAAKEWVTACAEAMRGLSLNEVRHLLARIVYEKKLNSREAFDEINAEKAQVLMKESCLKVYPREFDIGQIGGLEYLKQWVLNRKSLFLDRVQDLDVPRPSGVLMMGVSGCGKSMATKVIAGAWDLQLVRLDMSLIMSGAFGPPEYAFDRAIKAAENIAPLVLWIDEIENSFGYDEGPQTGGGNVNIFSSFLTWMQEKPSTIFVAATANRIQMLPAEMLRKGRFDQVFFLDLPTKEERKEIFKIHIKRCGGNPADFDMDFLATATKEWSGAEIEQAVKSARIDAFQEQRLFTVRDIARNTAKMVPLSKTMYEQVKKLRDWSFQRATPASKSGD